MEEIRATPDSKKYPETVFPLAHASLSLTLYTELALVLYTQIPNALQLEDRKAEFHRG
ncbi:hypothetical protein PGT21_030130 [Puccinia graminis f. sp. tritici]|uniref:Uncharacterized protein n=1 Tax=Puccinia graminis f. sp. tritici TaxID=56615 RepID=A0A5B0PV10_PUCGR|nr:hypothetical protein PGT21_030130 [Puccinia graminis f. sp. tritici]